MNVYNMSICYVGALNGRTNLHGNFCQEQMGDYRFSRKSDYQIAVTTVALMEEILQNDKSTDASTKKVTWHERSNNMMLKICHHRKFDGTEWCSANRNSVFHQLKESFQRLEEQCGAVY
eukprot:2540591-Ditylum_brightwellii.AAC.1